jgi:hypothetical protein
VFCLHGANIVSKNDTTRKRDSEEIPWLPGSARATLGRARERLVQRIACKTGLIYVRS